MSAIIELDKNDEIVCPYCEVNLSITKNYKIKRSSGFYYCYNCTQEFEVEKINTTHNSRSSAIKTPDNGKRCMTLA